MDGHQRLAADLEALCAIERPTASAGEHEAAEWLAGRLADAGARDIRIEAETVHGTFWWPVGLLAAAGVLAGSLGLRGRRRTASAVGLVAGALLADDVGNGRRPLRRILRRRTCWNVIGEAGEADAPRTVVILAHHDAPRTGVIFDGRPQAWLWRRAPWALEGMDTSAPVWWPPIGGPLLAGLGALLGRRGVMRAGTVVSAGTLAAMLDIGRSPTVPAANDNGSGVVALLEVARRLRDDPPRGVRVLLVSAGAEESLQEGIRAFAARWFDRLDPATTRFVNLETVGSTELALLEGEGTLLMEDYDPGFRDFVAETAATEGIALRRGLRTRLSTDSLVPHRAGFPVATLASVMPWKAPGHYHWPTDVPANVELPTVAAAVALTDAVTRRHGAGRPAP